MLIFIIESLLTDLIVQKEFDAQREVET
jgi:hypothetical protein